MVNAFIYRNGRGVGQWTRRFSLGLLALMMILATPALDASGGEGVSVELASNGQAKLPVIVAPSADKETRQAAGELAQYLSTITGATFEVRTGDGKAGLAVGTPADFPDLNLADQFDAKDIFQGEDYLLRSHAQGVLLIAATPRGVPNAVWDFLYRLGYRQFFPGKHWEVIPSTPELKVAVDDKLHPDYLGRRIWYGHGNWADTRPAKDQWDRRNRMADSLNIAMGHAWDSIYSANRKVFEEHPEYLVSKKPVKFRIGNADLRQLVVDHALRHFEKNPNTLSISMDPSDGGGWEDAEEEKQFASVSDRVVTLANQVAQAVNEKYPGRIVGMYAYHMHSPPPTIRVHPNVVVGVATSFIKGGYTVDQLMEGWSKQGAKLGIREYYSVVISHKEKPGGAPGSDVRRLIENTRRYHRNGARFMSAESSDSWGSIGLSYYVASRLYWNVNEDADAIIDDFFAKAFGPAQQPMRAFYEWLDRGNKPLFSTDQIGRMYRHLDEAYKLTDDPGIRARLDDLALYTRYAELLWEMQTQAKGNEESTGIVLGFAYRIRHTHMVHSYAMWRDTRGGGFAKPTGDHVWNIPEGKNPWKTSEPFTTQDIAGFIARGIEANPIAQFTPVSFGDELVSAAPLQLDPSAPQGTHGYTRGNQTFLLWLDEPGIVTLTVKAGQIAARGTATLRLYAEQDPTLETCAEVSFPIDKQDYDVQLTSPFKGLHRLVIYDGGKGCFVDWPKGARLVIPSSGDVQTLLRGRYRMYFYVPKGTRQVGGYADAGGSLVDPTGKVVHTFTSPAGYFSVPVPPGQDGKAWSIDKGSGRKLLMTVPPYLARHPSEMLLPREVVEADTPR